MRCIILIFPCMAVIPWAAATHLGALLFPALLFAHQTGHQNCVHGMWGFMMTSSFFLFWSVFLPQLSSLLFQSLPNTRHFSVITLEYSLCGVRENTAKHVFEIRFVCSCYIHLQISTLILMTFFLSILNCKILLISLWWVLTLQPWITTINKFH